MHVYRQPSMKMPHQLGWILLYAAAVSAQCDGPSITLTSTADIDSIASCQTYDGNIVIEGSFNGTDVSLPNLQVINGDLTISNVSTLASVRANSLTNITGSFTLELLDILDFLNFRALNSVNRIQWTALPALQSLAFDNGLASINSVYISNTGLTTLDGLIPSIIVNMDVNNNQYLKSVTLNNLVNITSTLSFSANDPDLSLSFASLAIATNLTFRNISDLSMPVLANTSGSFGLYHCPLYSFNIPKVLHIGGSLSLYNSNTSQINLLALQQIDENLELVDNSNLTTIDGFQVLNTIQGDLTVVGNFSQVDFLDLTRGLIKGRAKITTSSTNTSICDTFQTLKSTQHIFGTLSCNTSSTTANTQTSPESPSPSNPKHHHNLSRGAIAGISVGSIAAFDITILLPILLFLRRQKKRNLAAKSDNDNDNDDTEIVPGYTQLPLGKHHEKAEMFVDPKAVAEASDAGILNWQAWAQVQTQTHAQAREIQGVHESDAKSRECFPGLTAVELPANANANVKDARISTATSVGADVDEGLSPIFPEDEDVKEKSKK